MSASTTAGDLQSSPPSARPPKTAVIGATGFIGSYFLAAYRAYHPDAIGTSRRDLAGYGHLDLRAPDIRPLGLKRSGHTHAVIAAAEAKLQECALHPQRTREVNVAGMLELARQLTAEGIRVIWFSSDGVFDGRTGGYTDDAATNPVHEYGAQRVEVERQLPQVSGGSALIARVGKVYGLRKGDGTLLDEMAARLAAGQTVRAAFDQMLSPVLVTDVAGAVMGLQVAGVTGVVNVCGPEVISRYDLALAVAAALDVSPSRVERISLDDLGEAFTRAKRADLVCERLRAEAPYRFVPLSAAIAAVASHYR